MLKVWSPKVTFNYSLGNIVSLSWHDRAGKILRGRLAFPILFQMRKLKQLNGGHKPAKP